MKNVHRLVGYDSREMWLRPAAAGAREGGWTEENKRTWLLRPEVERPLSVDYLVWASVFSPDAQLVADVIPGDSIQGLWSDLYVMRSAIKSHRLNRAGMYWDIAVTLYAEDNANVGDKRATDLPIAQTDSWHFLGYDIADCWLLSGLTNCTHVSESDFLTLKRDYGPLLNSYHLLNDSETAETFRNLSDLRVQDHAPFSRFGLWRVREWNREMRDSHECH